jgi:hypothetical protein
MVKTSPSHSRRYRFAAGVKFRLTNRWPSVCFLRITEDQLQFTLDMKKIFVLSMLISFAMICSCQKQDSAAEQQLAQRKAQLDARENALGEREKALAERERAIVSARMIPPALQSGGQARAPAQAKVDPEQAKVDPEQARAERDRRLQQLGPDVNRLMPKDVQERRQRKLEALQNLRTSAGAAPPAAEATSPSPSPTPQ